MNEYMALDLMRQRTAERYQEARNVGLVRRLRSARRQRESQDALARQLIPDYVDGTFRPGDDLIGAKHESTTK
jgi:transposase